MPPRTTFALADRQKDSCLHPSRPKRNIIQKEKAGNAPSLAHEKGHRQTDRQTHRQTTTTLIASGPPLRGDPYFVCISTTLLRNYNTEQPARSTNTYRPRYAQWDVAAVPSTSERANGWAFFFTSLSSGCSTSCEHDTCAHRWAVLHRIQLTARIICQAFYSLALR